MTRRTKVLIAFLAVLAIAVALKPFIPEWMKSRVLGKKTVEDRVREFGPAAHARLLEQFKDAGIQYPPCRIALVGLKQEKQLQLYAADSRHKMRFICSYPILAASGTLGPKLRYGDCQVPEGIYPIESLNPNSSYHLSLRVGYPNDFDKQMAHNDNRDNLGGDIMIHGKDVSIGCIAIGDEASEDLFILAADTGLPHIEVILAPFDFRAKGNQPALPTEPSWTPQLYKAIKSKLAKLPLQQ